MSLPSGWMRASEFVCRDCATDDNREGIRYDERMASGRECVRCGARFPLLVRVRLLPDGWGSITAPTDLGRKEKVIRLEQDASTLIDQHALVYIDVGNEREVGITVTPHGKVEVWIHDDPYSDSGEPSERWTYDPLSTVPT